MISNRRSQGKKSTQVYTSSPRTKKHNVRKTPKVIISNDMLFSCDRIDILTNYVEKENKEIKENGSK